MCCTWPKVTSSSRRIVRLLPDPLAPWMSSFVVSSRSRSTGKGFPSSAVPSFIIELTSCVDGYFRGESLRCEFAVTLLDLDADCSASELGRRDERGTRPCERIEDHTPP